MGTETQRLRDMKSLVEAGSWTVDESRVLFCYHHVKGLGERGVAKDKGLTQGVETLCFECRTIRKWDACPGQLVHRTSGDKIILCNAWPPVV